MKTLVIGAGALGGVITARLLGAGRTVSLATRSAESALALRGRGLTVSGIGSPVSVQLLQVAATDEYLDRAAFDLVVLATKAHDALSLAPALEKLLAPGGTLLPIQNGGVSQVLADRLGTDAVLGGLSNLGATMAAPGVYEQRNTGHLLIGEIAGGESARAERVRSWLTAGVEVRVTRNIRGAVWSKLLLNCSVTTIGAIAGRTMREYMRLPEGRELFGRAYDEALKVALATGTRPERMLVDPIPPGWNGKPIATDVHDGWIAEILRWYGDIKPSMLQDFERGRTTEIDFINGYVVEFGQKLGLPVPTNAAIVEAVRAISRGDVVPSRDLLGKALEASRRT